MIDILRNPRFIAANTLAGLTLAATSGCGVSEQSFQDRIDASYSESFVNDPDTSCYEGIVDHTSIQKDLLDELQQRPWLDVDTLNGAYASAGNINTILEALHESAGAPKTSTGNYAVQPGDVYEFCVKDDTIGAGNPMKFSSIDYQ